MDQPQHLFLCAVGRSGTTAFRQSLGMHPEIYYNQFENNLVQDVAAVAELNCTLDSRQVAMAVSRATHSKIFRRAICDLIWPDPELRKRPVHMAAINPEGGQLDYLCELFPGAKIVCLIRNGIEVVSSRQRFESFAGDDFRLHCQRWMRSLPVILWGKKNTDRFRLFRHEWFYHPEKIKPQLTDLFRWLNLPSCHVVAENILGKIEHPTADGQEPSAATAALPDWQGDDDEQRKAYFWKKRSRWRQWTDFQRETFQEICRPLMDEIGYPIPWLTE